MKLNLDISKKEETAIQNFFRESMFLIMVARDGSTKTIILDCGAVSEPRKVGECKSCG